MKSSNKRVSIALTLLLISTSSLTASLGSHFNTSIVFDRVLDVTIPAQFDTIPEDVTTCFAAEVYQGGNRFDMNRLEIDVKPTDKPLHYVVRVRSTTSVTEPWAKLVLHNTCGPKIMRTYEFLTEFSSNLTPNIRNADTAGAVTTVGIKEAETVKRTLTQSPDVQTTGTQTTRATIGSASQRKLTAPTEVVNMAIAKRPFASKKVPLQSNLKSAKELQPSTAKTNGSPRLILENAPLLAENQIILKLTTDLLASSKSSDAEETLEHAQSMAQARAIWHALNAKTEDLAADALKLQDTTVQLAAQNQNNLDLSAKLRVAEQHTYTNSLVYALGALLALALVAVAWLWFKNRKASQAGYAWLGEEARAMPPLPLSQQTIEGDDPNSPEEEFVETAPLVIKKHEATANSRTRLSKPRAEKSPPTAPKPRKPRATSKKKIQATSSNEQSRADESVSTDRSSSSIENTTLAQPSTPVAAPRTDPIDVDLLFKKSPLHNPKAEKQADVLLKEAEAQVSDTFAKPASASSKKDNLIDFESFTLPPTRKKT